MPAVTPKHIIAVGIALPVLATVFVLLRLTARRYRLKSSIGADDWLIVFSCCICVGLGVMMIVGGAETALAQPTPSNGQPMGYAHLLDKALIIAEKMRFVNNLTSIVALGSIKLSVVLFYRRIFVGKTFRIISWALITLSVSWTITFFFAILFTCGTHVPAWWSTLDILLEYCPVEHQVQRSMAMTDVVIDALILSTPIPIVLRLQMSLRKRLVVVLIFLTGGVALAAGLIRLVQLYITTTNFTSKSGGNLLVSTIIYWTMVELGMSIVAACLPTLRPLFADQPLDRTMQSLREVFTLRSSTSSNSSHPRLDMVEDSFTGMNNISTGAAEMSIKRSECSKDAFRYSTSDLGASKGGISVRYDTTIESV